MNAEQVKVIKKWGIYIAIANTLMYLFIGFLCWDVLWISDINEWKGFSRFMFAFLGILFNIGVSGVHAVFFSEDFNDDVDKLLGKRG
jgi:hypothetical protein